MSSEWEYKSITEIVNFNPKHTINRGAKVPYVEMAAIPEYVREISYFQERKFKSGSKFVNGDTLFSRITPCLQNGKTSRVSGLKNEQIANGSTEFIVMSAKNATDKDFVYYLALDKEFRKYAEGRMEGTTGRQRVSWQSLSEYELPLPPKNSRKKIAHILSTLDDKIELNRRMNQTLEEMAQAIFKSWFVDFAPVYAKANASNSADFDRIAKELGISREILDLFPDKFEESELGMTPKGWIAGSFEFVFTERKEKVKDRDDVSVMSVVKTGEVVYPEDVFSKQVHSKDISKYKLLYPLDLGFNPSRVNIGSIGFNKKTGLIGAMSPIYIVMKLKDEKFYPMMELIIKTPKSKKWINTLASGSVRQSLSQKDFLSIPLIIPNDSLIREFNFLYKQFFESINANKAENQTLQETRDTLLPKLLSGELDVSELELDHATH